MERDRENMLQALKAIADMRVDEDTDHRQLSALCIGVARIALQKECCGDAACYNEDSGVPCSAMRVA